MRGNGGGRYPKISFLCHVKGLCCLQDCYILTVLSIMVQEEQLVTLTESHGLPHACHNRSNHVRLHSKECTHCRGKSLQDVQGERVQTHKQEQAATHFSTIYAFAKMLAGLSEIGRSDDLDPMLRSYNQSRLSVQSLSRASSGTPLETVSVDGPAMLFIA